jgi:hypothetical protein
MQWAQTLDREMDEKLDYMSAVRKNARNITVANRALHPRLPRLRNPDQLRRGKRYRWRFRNDETLRSPRLLSKDKELDYNFPM